MRNICNDKKIVASFYTGVEDFEYFKRYVYVFIRKSLNREF